MFVPIFEMVKTISEPQSCLLTNSRAAELLDTLPTEEENGQFPVDDVDESMQDTEVPAHRNHAVFISSENRLEALLESRETPRFLLAKSYFDTREYDRCAAVFLPPSVSAGGLTVYETSKGRTPTSTPSKGKSKARAEQPGVHNPYPNISQKSLFVALYARYLAGEKRRHEEAEFALGPNDAGHTINRELSGLARGLESYFLWRKEREAYPALTGGWLEYLYGMVLAKSKNDTAATEWLLESVNINPWNWGAWQELHALVSGIDQLNHQISADLLPQNIMSLIYRIHSETEMTTTTSATQTLQTIHELLLVFPESTFLQTHLATHHYHNKDFDTSARVFQEILLRHPYRLDALDTYSNILFVMDDKPRLSFLAHLATHVDKFRPETCCVVGNYYARTSQHEKAIQYFRRALVLDKDFSSAWTLMGHEYIELKNTHAAIESYRRAIDTNRRDYRAWYGLGQAYEVLDMSFYAIFYHQRAAALRPYDPKMWAAVASCYGKMGRLEMSIKAHKRALVAGTYYETTSAPTSFGTSQRSEAGSQEKRIRTGRKLLDPEILYQIALLYEKLGDVEEASRYMELTLAQENGQTSRIIRQLDRDHRKREREAEKAAAGTNAASAAINRKARALSVASNHSGDTEILSSQASPVPSASDVGSEDGEEGTDGDGFGMGTTATTSRARLWLARWASRKGDLERAERLAEELCEDGFEVEEAKGLAREIRGRREAIAGE